MVFLNYPIWDNYLTLTSSWGMVENIGVLQGSFWNIVCLFVLFTRSSPEEEKNVGTGILSFHVNAFCFQVLYYIYCIHLVTYHEIIDWNKYTHTHPPIQTLILRYYIIDQSTHKEKCPLELCQISQRLLRFPFKK